MKTKRFVLLASICAAVLASTGCNLGSASSSDSTSSKTSASSSTVTPSAPAAPTLHDSPIIETFYPASGSYAAPPSTVQITFDSIVTMRQSLVEDLTNWTWDCGAGFYYPLQVYFNGSTALVELPNIPNLSAGTVCNLNASSQLADVDGYGLTGIRTVSYTLTAGSNDPGTEDVTAPTGILTTPVSNDRVFGNVLLKAYAYDQGDNQSDVQSVEFWIDGNIKVGSATASPYQMTFNSNTVANGLHRLSITVIDNAGNKASLIDSRWILVANYGYETTLSTGGTGGSAFAEYAPTGRNLVGLQVRTGTYVNRLVPVWRDGFGSDPLTSQGVAHGGTAGTDHYITCPTSGNYRVVGVYGYSANYINKLGVLCAKQNPYNTSTIVIAGAIIDFDNMVFTDGTSSGGSNSDPDAAYYHSGTVGGSGGSSFSISCPAHKFVTAVKGRSGAYIDQISLGCR